MIKYIKSVLWRVAKRLSYIEDARCLKVKISCKKIRETLLSCRHSNDPNLKTYYKRYCKLLSKATLSVKKLHYNRIILNSNNKMITTLKTINHKNGKSNHCKNTISLKIDNKEITDKNSNANIFNSYFLSIAESLTSGNNKHTNIKEPNPIHYLINKLHRPFPKMSSHYASTYDIGKIIKSLKSKNSSGYDEISTRILILSAPYIISPLTYICNAILNNRIFPDNRLKYATINTFTAIVDLSQFNNSHLKSPVSTLVHLIFQSHSFGFNQPRDLSLLVGNCTAASVYLADAIPFIVYAYIAI